MIITIIISTRFYTSILMSYVDVKTIDFIKITRTNESKCFAL